MSECGGGAAAAKAGSAQGMAERRVRYLQSCPELDARALEVNLKGMRARMAEGAGLYIIIARGSGWQREG